MFETQKQQKEEIQNIQKQLNLWNKKSKLIQSQFNFKLPKYIIDEIIRNEKTKLYYNLHSLINLAIISNKLSTKNREAITKTL